MIPHAAETFALNVLTWLVGDEDLLPIFMNSTGTDGDALRENAGSPEFLGAVLDFLLWMMHGFCDVAKKQGLIPI